jgi:putative AlgH/UPF0301 family transcriptional regulator
MLGRRSMGGACWLRLRKRRAALRPSFFATRPGGTVKSRKIKFAWVIAPGLFLAGLLPGSLATCVSAAERQQGKMTFLVARRVIRDPYFERSVVFMLPTAGMPLVVGLIINKTAPVPLGKLFPESSVLKDKTATAYFGGPVEVRVPSLIFQAAQAPDHAFRLYGDVYLTFDSHLIVRLLEHADSPSKLRLFLGRAQWSPEQLQNEIGHDAWYTVRHRGDLIFSPFPSRLWQTLHDRAAPSHYIKYRLPLGATKDRPAAAGCEDGSHGMISCGFCRADCWEGLPGQLP